MKLTKTLMQLSLATLVLALGWVHTPSKAQLRSDLRDLRGLDDEFDIRNRSESLRLIFHGEIFGGRGGSQTLFLKQEILRRHPRLPIDEMQLDAVSVVGNSQSRRFSSSTVTLYVGDRYQDSARIEIDDYQRRRADVVDLIVRDRRLSSGRTSWQIDFDDATRVDQIVVEVSFERRPLPPPARLRSLGTFKAMKAVVVPVTLNVRDIIDTIHIRGVEKHVNIGRVEATLSNGRRILLSIRGQVSVGHVLREQLRQDLSIDSLEIHATSADLIGSRGEYEVLVGLSRRR